MAAPAGGSTTTTTVDQDEAVVNTTIPLLVPAPAAVICSSTAIGNALPRAIQLVMAIVWSGSKSSTTTTASTKTIGDDYGVDRYRLILWIHLVYLPSIFIAGAAGITYLILRDGGGGREFISGAGGFCFLAIPVLLFVYMAVLLAAWGHLSLFAPRTPYAAWEAFHRGTCYEGMGFLVFITSFGVWALKVIDQAWPLLVAWTYLLGLLIASASAFWLCLLRT